MPKLKFRPPNHHNNILKDFDMDVKGKLFGMRFIEGGSPEGLIELYIEDDENYHLKTHFNHAWLDDLIDIATKMKKRIKKGF